MAELVHQQIQVEGSEVVDCPADFEGECRRMMLGDGRDSVSIEVRATPQLRIKLGGRDLDDWLEERVVGAANAFPNDGRKLRNIQAHSPLVFNSNSVVD